jgi:hypothetical protein
LAKLLEAALLLVRGRVAPAGGPTMSINVTQAAFAGFAQIRRRPSLLLYWSGLMIGAWLLAGLVLGAVVWMGGGFGRGESPDAVLAGTTLFVWIVQVPMGLLLLSALRNASYPDILHPRQRSVGALRLGSDELRVLGVTVIMGVLLLLALWMPRLFLMLLVVGLSGAPVLAGLVMVVGTIAHWAGLAFLLVATSLAPVMTYAEKRLVLFESWSMVRPIFWPLVGVYLLVLLVFAVLMLVVGGAVVGALAATGFSGASSEPSTATAAILILALFVAWVVLAAFLNALLNGVHADIYRQLKPSDVAQVF